MESLHRKTRVALDIPGHAHFLTYSCLHRLPLLNKDRCRRWVIEAMHRVRRQMNVGLWAYVIMPEHVHVLLFPRDDGYEMRHILAGLKRSVSESAKEFLEATNDRIWLDRLTVRYPSRTMFRFWQPGGGFDRNIFRERTIRQVIEYIHANPVRRGLVSDMLDWEWSSARFWEGCREVPLEMDPLEI